MTQSHIFRDDPITGEVGSDLFDRDSFTDSTVKILNSVRAQGKSSCVLGLIGPWGSGKTSLTRIIERKLRESSTGWISAQFNPWAYSDLDSMTTGFFSELNSKLPSDGKWISKGKVFGDFVTSISPITSVLKLVGVDAQEALAAAGRGITNISESHLKRQVEELLELLDNPILMIIEDLDRLNPNELLNVFKLVRQLGRLPNVYYLLVYDEATLKDVITRTPLAKGDEQRATDYLEKLIQVRIDMPMFTDLQRENLVFSRFHDMLVDNDRGVTDATIRKVRHLYKSVWSSKFRTPRAIMRYFSQLSAFLSVMDDDVDLVDFMNITWIRVFYPKIYYQMQSRKSQLTKSFNNDVHGRDLIEGERVKLLSWLEHELPAGSEEIRTVSVALRSMFPRIEFILQEGNGESARWRDSELRLGIGSSLYFDRYFIFGVPPGQLTNLEIENGIRDIVQDVETEGAANVKRQIVQNTESTSRSIESVLRLGRVSESEVLQLLLREFQNVAAADNLFLDPKLRFALVGARCLYLMRDEEAIDFLSSQEFSLSQKELISEILNILIEADLPEFNIPRDWLFEGIELVSEMLESEFNLVSTVSLAEISEQVFSLLFNWVRIDSGTAFPWIRRQALIWGLREFMLRMVPNVYQDTGTEVVALVADLAMDSLDKLIGIDFVIETLGTEIQNLSLDMSTRYLSDTPENREVMAFRLLKKEMELRSGS